MHYAKLAQFPLAIMIPNRNLPVTIYPVGSIAQDIETEHQVLRDHHFQAKSPAKGAHRHSYMPVSMAVLPHHTVDSPAEHALH